MKPLFTSFLKTDLESFLAHKRALGFRYQRPEGTLRSFDRYVCRTRPIATAHPSLQSLIEGWLAESSGRKARTVTLDLHVVRQFCLFRRRRDPDGFVPDPVRFPRDAPSQFRPYIFSPAEIRSLLQYVTDAPVPKFQRTTWRLLLLILYCTGLRFGEVARLRIRDLDLSQRLFRVHESKGRTRLVPFYSDLAAELRRYLQNRGTTGLSADAPLLLAYENKAYSPNLISNTLRRWLRETGMKPPNGRKGPRPYDVRHTFAVHRLSQWYRQGVELFGRLPWLSVYMGHTNILGTEPYLTSTPELLALVSRKFQARFDQRRRPM